MRGLEYYEHLLWVSEGGLGVDMGGGWGKCGKGMRLILGGNGVTKWGGWFNWGCGWVEFGLWNCVDGGKVGGGGNGLWELGIGRLLENIVVEWGLGVGGGMGRGGVLVGYGIWLWGELCMGWRGVGCGGFGIWG